LVIGILKYYKRVGRKEYQPWADKALKELQEITGLEW